MVSVGPSWMALHIFRLLGFRFLVCKTDLGRTAQCVCVCVCVCVCMHACTCVCVRACMHVYLSFPVWGWSEGGEAS